MDTEANKNFAPAQMNPVVAKRREISKSFY